MSQLLPNSTQVPNLYFDSVLPYLEPEEWAVLSYACRRIFGFNQTRARISLNQFHEGVQVGGERKDGGTGLSIPTIRKAVELLVSYQILVEIEAGCRETNTPALYELQLDDRLIDWPAMHERREVRRKRTQAIAQKAHATRKAAKATPSVTPLHSPMQSDYTGDPMQPGYTALCNDVAEPYETGLHSPMKPGFTLRNPVETQGETQVETQPPCSSTRACAGDVPAGGSGATGTGAIPGAAPGAGATGATPPRFRPVRETDPNVSPHNPDVILDRWWTEHLPAITVYLGDLAPSARTKREFLERFRDRVARGQPMPDAAQLDAAIQDAIEWHRRAHAGRDHKPPRTLAALAQGIVQVTKPPETTQDGVEDREYGAAGRGSGGRRSAGRVRGAARGPDPSAQADIERWRNQK